MRLLRDAYGVPFGLPATQWMLELGAVFMRTETELILKSRRVVPTRLLGHGFRFTFPSWNEATIDLCRQWKAIRDVASPGSLGVRRHQFIRTHVSGSRDRNKIQADDL
jgi:hypothetical protein